MVFEYFRNFKSYILKNWKTIQVNEEKMNMISNDGSWLGNYFVYSDYWSVLVLYFVMNFSCYKIRYIFIFFALIVVVLYMKYPKNHKNENNVIKNQRFKNTHNQFGIHINSTKYDIARFLLKQLSFSYH